jgi:hypothetical protein
VAAVGLDSTGGLPSPSFDLGFDARHVALGDERYDQPAAERFNDR